MMLDALSSSLLLLLLIGQAASDRTDVKDGENLLKAMNAALMATVYGGETQALIRSHGREHRVSTMCNAVATYDYPDYDSLSKNDGLKEVIDSGELIIQGVGPGDWGKDGDYTADPPTGFWPDYLQRVVTKLGVQYGKSIDIKRVYTPTQDPDEEGLISSVVDASDIYFLLNGLVQNVNGTKTKTRKHFYLTSCAAAERGASVVVKASKTFESFNDFLVAFSGLSIAEQVMGVLSEANRDTVIGAFPTTTTWRIYSSDEELRAEVADETAYGGIVTGLIDDPSDTVQYLSTGLNSHYGFLLRDRSASIRTSPALSVLALVLAIVTQRH